MKTPQRMDWGNLEQLIDAGDARAVLPAICGLDQQRHEIGKPLEAYARQIMHNGLSGGPQWWVRFQRLGRVNAALLVALTCLPSAATVAKWLGREDLWQGDLRYDVLLEALHARPAEWRRDVADRMARSLRATDFRLAQFVIEFARDSGGPPPVELRFLTLWVQTRAVAEAPSLADALRRDRLAETLIPALFSVEGAGPLLATFHGGRPLWMWPAALAELVDHGELDRGLVVDGCLRGLLRGGDAPGLRGYRSVFEALAPTPDDLAPHAQTLVRLLSDAPSAIAGLALTQLRALDQASRLTSERAVDALQAALRRSEKKLASAGLSWLDAQARTREGVLDAAVPMAFEHPDIEVQRRAVVLVRRLASRVVDPVVLVNAGAALPTDLRAELVTVLGSSDPVDGPPAVPSSTVDAEALVSGKPAASRAAPAPIGSAGELAEELSALLNSPGGFGRAVDPMALERVLAGLVAFAHLDRAALARALAPVLTRAEIAPGLPTAYQAHPLPTLRALAGAAVGPVEALNPVMGAASHDGDWKWRTGAARQHGPTRVLLHRLYEATGAAAYRSVPALVSTPTTTTGHLEPEVLLARLSRASTEGWQPLQYDLEQALLRLPREVEPTIVGRARQLDTDAGNRVATWVEVAGMPDPVIRTVGTSLRRRKTAFPHDFYDSPVLLASIGDPVESAPFDRDAPMPPGLRPLLGSLFIPDNVLAGDAYIDLGWTTCWPYVLPSHRDVIAAHLVGWLAVDSRGMTAPLPMLAEGDGPVGPGLALAIAYALGGERPGDRAAATDAMLLLAARGHLHATEIGGCVGSLVALEQVKLSRVVPTLRDLVTAGSAGQAWLLVSAVLRALLPLPKPANRLSDLLTLGFEAAEASGHRGTFDELAATAGRSGTNRVTTEARRLHRFLTGEG